MLELEFKCYVVVINKLNLVFASLRTNKSVVAKESFMRFISTW